MAPWHGLVQIPDNTFAVRAHLLKHHGFRDHDWYGKLTDMRLDELDGLHNHSHQLLADLDETPNHEH